MNLVVLADVTSGIPGPEDFSKALFVLDIGQNDLWAGITLATEEQLRASIPNITNRFALVVEVINSTDAHFDAGLFDVEASGSFICGSCKLFQLCSFGRNCTEKVQEPFGYTTPVPLAACRRPSCSITRGPIMWTQLVV